MTLYLAALTDYVFDLWRNFGMTGLIAPEGATMWEVYRIEVEKYYKSGSIVTFKTFEWTPDGIEMEH